MRQVVQWSWGPLVGGGRPRTGGGGPDRTAATTPTVLSSPRRRGCARSLAPGSAALAAHPRTVNLREDVVTARINQWIGSLFAPHNHVFYRKCESTFSCYRFDKVAILTLYTHSRKRTQVPTIVCEDGSSLYEFIRAELCQRPSCGPRWWPCESPRPSG